MNPLDESGYYFNMLGLKEEQLFVEGKDGRTAKNRYVITVSLPGHEHHSIVQLSEEINITCH